jgi:FtsZ-binding cell division protein ZapB
MSNLSKLSKILPMLGSSSEGEIVAAVAAIGRMLVADGKDWHWLTTRLSGPGTPPDSFGDNKRAVQENRRLRTQVSVLSKENAALRYGARDLQKDVCRLDREVAALKAQQHRSWTRRDPGDNRSEGGDKSDGESARRRWLFRVGKMLERADANPDVNDDAPRALRALLGRLECEGYVPGEYELRILTPLWAAYVEARTAERA